MCAKGKSKKARAKDKKKHSTEPIETYSGHQPFAQNNEKADDILYALIRPGFKSRFVSSVCMIFPVAFLIKLFAICLGESTQIVVLVVLGLLSAMAILWFYYSFFSYTKIYEDRISFRGRHYLKSINGTVSLDEIETVELRLTERKYSAINDVEIVITKINKERIEWHLLSNDVGGVFSAMRGAMYRYAMMYQRQNVSLPEQEFVLQCVSEYSSSTDFYKQSGIMLPVSRWPLAVPFSMKQGDVLCVFDGSIGYFFKMLDFSGVCARICEHFPNNIRMGLSANGSLFTEEEAERAKREDNEIHLIVEKYDGQDVLLASISSGIWQKCASFFLMLLFAPSFLGMLYTHFQGNGPDYATLVGIGVMAVFSLLWFYCSFTAYTKVYSDRIAFKGYRYVYFPCKGTISLNDIEYVRLSGRSNKNVRVYEIETTVVESSGKKIKWKIPTHDVNGMCNTMARAMLASTKMYQNQNALLPERKFILQRVSDRYASVIFYKQNKKNIPFTQWPKAVPFSMKLGEVLCAMNQDDNKVYFFKMLDLSNVCSLVNKHFSKSVRMGQASDVSLFTEEDAKRIAKEDWEKKIVCWFLIGAFVLLPLFLIYFIWLSAKS